MWKKTTRWWAKFTYFSSDIWPFPLIIHLLFLRLEEFRSVFLHSIIFRQTWERPLVFLLTRLQQDHLATRRYLILSSFCFPLSVVSREMPDTLTVLSKMWFRSLLETIQLIRKYCSWTSLMWVIFDLLSMNIPQSEGWNVRLAFTQDPRLEISNGDWALWQVWFRRHIVSHEASLITISI